MWHGIYIIIPKGKKGSIVRKYCNKITPKASWRNTILCIFIMMSKYSSDLQLFSALLTTTHFHLFGLAPHKSTALFGRNPTALSPPTF